MGDSWTANLSLQTPPPSSLLLGRRAQWSQQHVGETWLCWSQSLSFLNKHFPFWNNHLTIYRKHHLLQSKSLFLWKGISLKLFSSFYKTPASPLLSGFYLSVNSVDQRHMFSSHKNNLDSPCRSCAPYPHHMDFETMSVITIHTISETTSPSHFLPADFQGNRRRLVCYQGGSPGLTEQLSKRHLWEWGTLVSVSSQRLLPNEVTLLQKRGWRDSRRMEEARTGSRAVSSTGLSSVNFPLWKCWFQFCLGSQTKMC